MKCENKGKKLHCAFVYHEKAFDRVDRELTTGGWEEGRRAGVVGKGGCGNVWGA